MGASATKSFARSRIFRYELRYDTLSSKKPRQGGAWFKGLKAACGADWNIN